MKTVYPNLHAMRAKLKTQFSSHQNTLLRT